MKTTTCFEEHSRPLEAENLTPIIFHVCILLEDIIIFPWLSFIKSTTTIIVRHEQEDFWFV